LDLIDILNMIDNNLDMFMGSASMWKLLKISAKLPKLLDNQDKIMVLLLATNPTV